MSEDTQTAWKQHRETLIKGIWERLGRYARGTVSQRMFLIGELTHVVSCTDTQWK